MDKEIEEAKQYLLYNMHFETDVNKASETLEKHLKVLDNKGIAFKTVLDTLNKTQKQNKL